MAVAGLSCVTAEEYLLEGAENAFDYRRSTQFSPGFGSSDEGNRIINSNIILGSDGSVVRQKQGQGASTSLPE